MEHRDLALQHMQEIMDQAYGTMKWIRSSRTKQSTEDFTEMTAKLEEAEASCQTSYSQIYKLLSEGKTTFEDLHRLQIVIQQLASLRYHLTHTEPAYNTIN